MASRVIASLCFLNTLAGQPHPSPLSHGRFNGPRDRSGVGDLTSPSTLIHQTHPYLCLSPSTHTHLALLGGGPLSEVTTFQVQSTLQPQICPHRVPWSWIRGPTEAYSPEKSSYKLEQAPIPCPLGPSPASTPLSFQRYQVLASTPLGMESRENRHSCSLSPFSTLHSWKTEA